MRPVAWSSSYLFRWPFGISTVTSNCTRLVLRTVAPLRSAEVTFWGVGSIASSGSTIITANYGRFRRRIAMGVIALIVVVVGAVVGISTLTKDSPAAPDDVVAVPEAVLPDLGAPAPVLASLSADAPAPDPAALSAQLTPILQDPGMGTGVSAEVVDVATGDVLLDL